MKGAKGTNKAESKYFNTAKKMDAAFLALLEQKDFEYITVKEICEKAKVNRSTFYLHYETIGDLLAESVSYINENFLNCFPQGADSIAQRLNEASLDELYLLTPKYLIPYLSYIEENKKLFLTAIQNPTILQLQNSYEKMFRYVLEPIMQRFNIPEEERKYLLTFYVGGSIAIVKEWLRRDCTDPADRVAKIIMERVVRLKTGGKL